MEAPGPCHLLDGLAAEKRVPRGAGWPWGVSSFFTSEATFPGQASVSPFQHFLTARAAPQSRNLGSVSLPWSLSCCASVSTCFVEKLERGVPGEATSEPRPPQDGDSPGPRAAGEGWREQDSEQPQAGQSRAKRGTLVPGSGGLRGLLCQPHSKQGLGGRAHQRAGPGAAGGERVCGEPAPQFKGETGSSPRREEKETSGLWRLRAWGAAGRGGWRGEESLAQSRLGPPPAPPLRALRVASRPALPCLVRARRGDRRSSRGPGPWGWGCSLGRPSGPSCDLGRVA